MAFLGVGGVRRQPGNLKVHVEVYVRSTITIIETAIMFIFTRLKTMITQA